MSLSQVGSEQPRRTLVATAIDFTTLGIFVVAGSVCLWLVGNYETWRYGGVAVPVHLSRVGEIIYCAVGAVFGCIGGTASILICQVSTHPYRRIFLLAGAVPLGFATAYAGYVILAFTLFTIPQEWFDVLTD